MPWQVCGVQCPSVGRRGSQPGEGSQEPATEAVPPQPFALEAKHFSEVAVLNREVRIVLQGVDKHDNLIGSVMYPTGGPESTDLADLGLQLVERGLARVSIFWPSDRSLPSILSRNDPCRTLKGWKWCSCRFVLNLAHQQLFRKIVLGPFVAWT